MRTTQEQNKNRTILESLEKMLDVYRQRCLNQSAEIAALKEAMGSISATGEPDCGTFCLKREKALQRGSPTKRDHFTISSCYIDDIADELDSALARNQMLDEKIAHLQKRLHVEQEWRNAAMEWMESDRRMHKHISKVLNPDNSNDSTKKNPIYASYQQSLHKVLEKSRELEQRMTNMLS